MAPVIETLRRKTMVAEASRTYVLSHWEIAGRVENGHNGMKNA